MKRSRFLSVLLLLLVLPAAGCVDLLGTRATIEGTYTLQQINGQNLPVVVYDDAEERDEVLSGAFTFTANGTWTASHTLRTVYKLRSTSFTDTYPLNGTYTLSGNSVQLTDSFNDTYVGTWSGNEVIIDLGEPGQPLRAAYRR